MNESINFSIRFETQNDAEKALTILKEMTLNDPSYDGWLNFWKDELIVENTYLTVNDDNSYCDENHDISEFVAVIFPAIIHELRQKMKGTIYEGYALYSDSHSSYQEDYAFDPIAAKRITSPNGSGFCEDCGIAVVYIWEYEPDQDYYCPFCGKVFDQSKLFCGKTPTIQYL